MSGPSGTPAPTGCVYRAAPVFGKPPIWTQQSRCTITDRRVSARYAGAAAGMGVQAIRCGTFLYRGWNRTREIQKPLVFGGVLFHISFAVERNMAAGGIEKKVVGPLRPKVVRARERGIFPPEGAIQAPPVADTARWASGRGQNFKRPPSGSAEILGTATVFLFEHEWGRRPLRGASIWVRRKMRTGCGAKKVRSAVDRTRCAIGVGGGESRRCHSAGTK